MQETGADNGCEHWLRLLEKGSESIVEATDHGQVRALHTTHYPLRRSPQRLAAAHALVTWQADLARKQMQAQTPRAWPLRAGIAQLVRLRLDRARSDAGLDGASSTVHLG